MERLDFRGTQIEDLSALADMRSLYDAAKSSPYWGGIEFRNCATRDAALKKISRKNSPARTVLAIAYLRKQQGLPPWEDKQDELAALEQEPDGKLQATDDDDSLPTIEAIPAPERRAIQFDEAATGPIDLAPANQPDEKLANSVARIEDYRELRAKAADLKAVGPNRLGHLYGPIDRFLDLPSEIAEVRAKLFWSRINTLRIKIAAHEEAMMSSMGMGDPDDRLLELSVAPLLQDLVETINIFVLNDPVLMDLDAARPGPRDIAEAVEEAELLTEVLNDVSMDSNIATQTVSDILQEQLTNVTTAGSDLSGRQAADFGKRTIRNFIGALLRRAYAPVHALIRTAKSETGFASKEIRSGAYKTIGGSLVTAAITDASGMTNVYGTFFKFIVAHADALTTYVTKAFQNPTIVDIINWIVRLAVTLS